MHSADIEPVQDCLIRQNLIGLIRFLPSSSVLSPKPRGQTEQTQVPYLPENVLFQMVCLPFWRFKMVMTRDGVDWLLRIIFSRRAAKNNRRSGTDVLFTIYVRFFVEQLLVGQANNWSFLERVYCKWFCGKMQKSVRVWKIWKRLWKPQLGVFIADHGFFIVSLELFAAYLGFFIAVPFLSFTTFPLS